MPLWSERTHSESRRNTILLPSGEKKCRRNPKQVARVSAFLLFGPLAVVGGADKEKRLKRKKPNGEKHPLETRE